MGAKKVWQKSDRTPRRLTGCADLDSHRHLSGFPVFWYDSFGGEHCMTMTTA